MPKFSKGQSGNPGGRPKTTQAQLDLIAEIRRQLQTDGAATRLIAALIAEADSGNVRAIQEILNRIHGVVQPIRAEPIDILTLITEAAKRATDHCGDGDPGGSDSGLP